MTDVTGDAEFELARLREQQAAVAEVLAAISRMTTDVQPVLDTILAHAKRLCAADDAGLWQREADGLFHFVAHHGTDIPTYLEYARAHPQAETASGTVGRVARARASIQIADLAQDPNYPVASLAALQRDLPSGTALGVPLLLDGAVIGVLSILRERVRAFTEREVGLVEIFAEQAALALSNANLFQTVQRQREELSRFLSPQVSALITSEEGKRLLDGHRREVTVVFCDFRGFTPFAEAVEPEEVMAVLRTYHETMGALIAAHGGTLEHFEGDGMMVFFNDPVEMSGHPLHAVRMAIAMRDRFAEISPPWRKKGYDLGLGFGAALGYATLGRIGYEGRYDYAAIGNVTILASRLSSRAASGQILVSQRLNAAIEGHFETAPVGDLELKGMSRPTPAFSVLRPKE
ncbi:MAG TPA: adenylate/guanylate cyclase domain-containing protein [Candidatus Limnocylindria bacterium]|nr:adenylate/guanylate cyclase domain-containing protein [Candidatus Limnocylindria bacterium]